MRQNPQVCVEVSEVEDLTHWKSVILEGKFEEITGIESLDALQSLISQLEPKINKEGRQHVEQIGNMALFPNEQSPKVIYRIRIEERNMADTKQGNLSWISSALGPKFYTGMA